MLAAQIQDVVHIEKPVFSSFPNEQRALPSIPCRIHWVFYFGPMFSIIRVQKNDRSKQYGNYRFFKPFLQRPKIMGLTLKISQ